MTVTVLLACARHAVGEQQKNWEWQKKRSEKGKNRVFSAKQYMHEMDYNNEAETM